MTNTHTIMNNSKAPALALLMTLAGSLAAAHQDPTKPISTSPITLTSSQTQSIQQSYNWLDRDGDIASATNIIPRFTFIETPGLKERSGYLNVQIKSRDQMLLQMTIDHKLPTLSQATLHELNQTRAANSNPVNPVIEQAQHEIAIRIAQAERRITQARTRIDPSMRMASDDINMHSVHIPVGVSAEVAAELLMQTGDYEFVSMDWICYPTDTTPNDPQFNQQWHHASDRIDTVGAWDTVQGSSGSIVAICDTGVKLTHPDLAGSLVSGYNAVTRVTQADGANVDDEFIGHGTQVAGSAAAIGNNGTGVAGVGWNVGIMPVRVSDDPGGNALLSNILHGARWASDNGAYAVNVSFSGASDIAVNGTGNHLRLEGHLLVYAGGNDGLANQVNDWQNVTIVGSSNTSDNITPTTHTGIGIDCIAPGVNIRTTSRNGGYTTVTGSSYSAPIAAASMLLIHEANPALTADEVEFTLLNTCDDKGTPGEDNESGRGRINVGQAVHEAIFGPSTLDLPFEDEFAEDTLSNKWENPVGDVDVSSNAVNIPTGLYAMNLDDQDTIETIKMRASVLAGTVGQINFYTQHRGVEASESLIVEYLNALQSWTPLTTIDSDGSNQDNFTHYRSTFPPSGLHDGFKIRFAANGSDTSDDWYIDDFAVSEFTGNTVPWNESFETGISLDFDWESSDATATANASNEPDGIMSAQLNANESMTTADIVTPPLGASVVFYRFYTQHTGTDAGETLSVEYKNVSGVWKHLTTITSGDSNQTNFELSQAGIFFDAYNGPIALRFTANGDQQTDTWFIDDIAVSFDFIEESNCPADINNDGTLDFFDVGDFLNAFTAENPIGDFNGDSLFDFFDIGDFLNAFGQGCP